MGWIKIDYNILSWRWYRDQNVKAVFLHCLLIASKEDHELNGEKLEAGEFITTIDQMAHELGMTYWQVEYSLRRLCSTGELCKKKMINRVLIRVLKFAEYQIVDKKRSNKVPIGFQHDSNTNKEKVSPIPPLNRKTRDVETLTSVTNVTSPTRRISDDDFEVKMREHYPTVMSLKKPLTYDQYEKLMKTYSVEQIKRVIRDMENNLQLTKKYKSAYATAQSWLERSYGKQNQYKEQPKQEPNAVKF